MLSDEQKHLNKVNRTYERYKTLTIGKVKNDVLKEFQMLRRLECCTGFKGTDPALQCISCGYWVKWKEADAGHYLSRKFTATAFSRENVHGQCVHCNQHLNGNLIEYRKGLVSKIGEAEVKLLEAWKDTETVYSKWQYAQAKECYRVLIKQVKKGLSL